MYRCWNKNNAELKISSVRWLSWVLRYLNFLSEKSVHQQRESRWKGWLEWKLCSLYFLLALLEKQEFILIFQLHLDYTAKTPILQKSCSFTLIGIPFGSW